MKKMVVLLYSMVIVSFCNVHSMQEDNKDNEKEESTFWQRTKSVGSFIANVHPTGILVQKMYAVYKLGQLVYELHPSTTVKTDKNNSIFSWFSKKEKKDFHRKENPQVIRDVNLRHAIDDLKSLEEIKNLLEDKANPNSQGVINKSLVPLIYNVIIAYKNDPETLKHIVQTFIEYGADIYNFSEYNNNTLLHVAAQEGAETFKTICLLTTDKPSDYEKKVITTFILINKELGAYKIPKPLFYSIINEYVKIPVPNKSVSIATPYLLSIKNNNQETALDVLFNEHRYTVNNNNELIKAFNK